MITSVALCGWYPFFEFDTLKIPYNRVEGYIFFRQKLSTVQIRGQRNLRQRRFKSALLGFMFSPAGQTGKPSGSVSIALDSGEGFLALRGLGAMEGTTEGGWQSAQMAMTS